METLYTLFSLYHRKEHHIHLASALCSLARETNWWLDQFFVSKSHPEKKEGLLAVSLGLFLKFFLAFCMVVLFFIIIIFVHCKSVDLCFAFDLFQPHFQNSFPLLEVELEPSFGFGAC